MLQVSDTKDIGRLYVLRTNAFLNTIDRRKRINNVLRPGKRIIYTDQNIRVHTTIKQKEIDADINCNYLKKYLEEMNQWKYVIENKV